MALVKTELAKIPLEKPGLPKYHYHLDFLCHNTTTTVPGANPHNNIT
jgi:hypothetical protein